MRERSRSARTFHASGLAAMGWVMLVAATAAAVEPPTAQGAIPPQLERWLVPQDWRRDTDGPILQLGTAGAFDDTHIFAPCVARLDDRYFLWYSGSTGVVAERVFELGLATSRDGSTFARQSETPVFRFGDRRRSILTATLLRHSDGRALRENGKLRMWFSATDFVGGNGLHTLHESTSGDGIAWSAPSEALLENVYAPTILKDGDRYRMWYTDVAPKSWTIRLAESDDGRRWRVRPDPVLQVEQAWEKERLFYPTVLKVDRVYLMWYGSYRAGQPNQTAIGFAASQDGITWFRNPNNPVLQPDPNRPWESHYTTSQSIIRFDDGSFRIWYASRKAPPFVNKYFALNTAGWKGPTIGEKGSK